MKLDVFLSFNGQAEEAFRFYADLFQTEIKGLVRASENGFSPLPAAWRVS